MVEIDWMWTGWILQVAILAGIIDLLRPKDCCGGVSKPKRWGGLLPVSEDSADPPPEFVPVCADENSSACRQNLLRLDGSGVFISAEIAKRGGTDDDTKVVLDIDGNKVVSYPMKRALVQGLDRHNHSGVSLFVSDHDADVKTLVIAFQVPLKFEDHLHLYVVVKEANVRRIIGNVYYGCFKPSGGGEGTNDANGEIP